MTFYLLVIKIWCFNQKEVNKNETIILVAFYDYMEYMIPYLESKISNHYKKGITWKLATKSAKRFFSSLPKRLTANKIRVLSPKFSHELVCKKESNEHAFIPNELFCFDEGGLSVVATCDSACSPFWCFPLHTHIHHLRLNWKLDR